MTKCQRQSVRRIIGSWDLFQVQEPFGHVHHLAFFRPSIARNCLLDLKRGIFKDRNAIFCAGKQNHPSSVGDLNAGCNIRVEKQFLDGNGIWLQELQQLGHIVINQLEPLGKIHASRCCNSAISKHLNAAPVRGDESKADGSKAGVDAQDFFHSPSTSPAAAPSAMKIMGCHFCFHR